MKAKLKIIIFALVLTICLTAAAHAGLAQRINSIIAQKSQNNVKFAVHIINADTGKTIYSHNKNNAMVPASNMKIIISAVALKHLGPDYQFKTPIALAGNDLLITGSGDPLLGDKITDAKYHRAPDWIFEDIAAKLKAKKQTFIEDIVIDTSIFDDERVHPSWPKSELNRWYACEVSGLNFNANCIDMTVTNNAGRAAVALEPATDYIKIVNKVKTISTGKQAVGTYRNQVPNKIIVWGKCKNKQGPFSVAIEQPAAFFGFMLAEYLTKAGIEVKGQLIGKPTAQAPKLTVLAEYRTTMSDCLARCNKDSFGLAAEAMMKTIAANTNIENKAGSWPDGRQIISDYLIGLGIGAEQFYIDDGSGLSRENRLSAKAITTVLRDIYKSKDWPIYKDSLAVGGVDGTIKKYFKDEKYKGKIIGKTGYINSVKSFSGVCSGADGDYIFSILTYKTKGQTRKAINDIAKAIINSQ